ncbi:uncharacterized protein TNCV_583271 [Trichonephila clavipes]|nr:uncharacterized protein TNCV_583271 [Trichonephila clavipes]
MTDILSNSIRALNLLGLEHSNLSDLLLLNIILKKIDRETRKQFEQSIDSNQIPELDTFIMFLEKRSQTIDSINRSAPITHKPKRVPFHKEHSLEEEICGTQYQTTHYRTEEGRYVVQLPLKKDPYCLGSSDFQEFQKLQLELISFFKKAGKSLHKWCSNTPEILNSIPKEEQSRDFHCQSSDQKTIKTLGIIWSPQLDYFSFKAVVNCRESYTKREVLSIIARLLDPLRFLGPILTKAKLILQKLWVLKLEWDETLSNPIANEWNDFVSTLPVIQNIHVPRLVIGKGRIIIHGFADASTTAYGAVLYAQSISEEDVSTNPVLHR